MKNFEEHLEQKKYHHVNINAPHQQSHLLQLKQLPLIQKFKSISIKVLTPLALSILTAPFNTASILLQVSNKPFVNSINLKLEGLEKNDILIKHIKNGIFGQNRPFKSFQFTGYKDALAQLGKQGVKGMYKGNLTGIIYLGLNSKLRGILYEYSSQQLNKTSSQLTQNLITVATCTLSDFITLPLMFCQSRLVLQNSLPNLRVYKNPFQIMKKTSAKMWISGASVLIFKNGLFALSWLKLIKESPVYSFVISSLLSHLIIYPFTTVIRQLQTNDQNQLMMNKRVQNVRGCAKRIWTQQGFRGFYRGFAGYSVVHGFMGMIMLQMNLRTGYFQSQMTQ